MNSPSPDERPTQIGRRIRDMRDDRGIKQKYLARKAGISREELSRIERGHVKPLTQTLEGLCLALEVPLAQLLEMKGGERDEN
jgi:transcriptional regulator with XRE-family HTH domain